VAGALLLVIAMATWWETRRPRRFPWSAVSAPLWMAFSVYLFLSGDPEAWPLGPGTPADALADALVVQHKALAAIPMVIGVVEMLGRAGRLRSSRWRAVVPTLVLLGGITIFVHSHHGGQLDRMFLHHAAMGAAAVTGGAALLLAQRTETGRTVLARGWPALLALIALLLLVYSEM
jgi:putative copper resistance protein D